MYARDFETDFRDVQNLFEERVPTTDSELQEYLHNYPYTPYRDEIHFMQGVL